MFGYVRPCKAELRVRELELFQAAYCGLCHALKARCGVAGRFAVNYDFTVLAMLLSTPGENCAVCKSRCVASPLRKKKRCAETGAIGEAAEKSLVLLWWKLGDGLRDGNFRERLRCRLYRSILRRGLRRARERQPAFDAACGIHIRALSALEEGGCASLDMAADPFARLLAEAAGPEDGTGRLRALRQLLYHLGRFVYIADAVCDRKEDRQAGRYNPVLARYGQGTEAALPEDAKRALRETLLASAGQASAALALLDANIFTSVLENIMALGLPDMAERVVNETKAADTERRWRIG